MADPQIREEFAIALLEQIAQDAENAVEDPGGVSRAGLRELNRVFDLLQAYAFYAAAGRN